MSIWEDFAIDLLLKEDQGAFMNLGGIIREKGEYCLEPEREEKEIDSDEDEQR